MTIKLARDLPAKPYNDTLARFHPKYWTIDYNALMVATILPINERGFKVPGQWRTNADFMGVRWQSEDRFDHEYVRYATDNNYRDTILAFRANPSEPHKFTVTITIYDQSFTHRLVPYVLNPATNRWEDLDPLYGSGNTYPADVIIPKAQWTPIPDEEMQEFETRKDYIYILDFNDMRLFAMLDGPRIPADNIASVSFDTVEWTHGLGRYANIYDIQNLGGGMVRLEIGSAIAGAMLTPGDKLQAVYRYFDAALNKIAPRQGVFEVVSWEGFGTSALTVVARGEYPGRFIECDAFYARYLKTTAPSELIDSTKYFVDMTLTGVRKTISKRYYPQPAHQLMMTSGFDDGYNLTPDRQVEMVHDLGYRGFWTTYIGMSHYFNARTAWMDRDTGDVVIVSPSLLDFPVLFAGEGQMAVHFILGGPPDRGRDAFQRKVGELFGVNPSNVVPINGTTSSSAADRAAAVNPDSEKFDPLQLGGKGGLWWWDLEADKPGPAFVNTIRKLNMRKPKVVIWGQGDQDASVIEFPGTRDPKPTIERTKDATLAIFNHMRTLWGADLKIFIQEQGWGWTYDAIEMPVGMPVYMNVTRNSWGDVVFNWLSFKEDPRLYTYTLEILNPNDENLVLRTFVVYGADLIKGLMNVDWPVEVNVGDSVTVFGEPKPWEFVTWRLTRQDKPELTRTIRSGIRLDNRVFVKKTVIMGINSLIGGYFNDLSDPLNPGSTGAPGRKDVVAASTFRKALAQATGLRDVEVMPIMAAVGSSSINPMPYQPGFPAENYWWNPVTNEPGPNLILADEIVKALGVAPNYFVESGSSETWGLMYLNPGMRPDVAAQFRTSNIAMLAWMRENWGNNDLELWFQGATTNWWGFGTPMELSGPGVELMRDAQRELATTVPGFKLGTWVPDSNWPTVYRDEMDANIGWVHYTVGEYHTTAAELGQSIGLDRNLAGMPPEWVTLRVPTGMLVWKLKNGDIRVEWEVRPGITKWYCINRNVVENTALKIMTVEIDVDHPTPEFIFTKAEQIAAYGFETWTMFFEVSEWITTRGASQPFSSEVTSGLATPENLLAKKRLNGDIWFTWDINSESGHTEFYWENMDPSNAVIGSGTVATGGDRKAIFTKAKQVAQYGFEVTFVNFKVSEYRSDKDAIGKPATWAADAVPPPYPLKLVTGFSASQNADGDWIFSWNAPTAPDRGVIFTCLNVSSGGAIFSMTTMGTMAVFSKAAQIAEYGFPASTVAATVCEYDYPEAVAGPLTYL